MCTRLAKCTGISVAGSAEIVYTHTHSPYKIWQWRNKSVNYRETRAHFSRSARGRRAKGWMLSASALISRPCCGSKCWNKIFVSETWNLHQMWNPPSRYEIYTHRQTQTRAQRKSLCTHNRINDDVDSTNKQTPPPTHDGKIKISFTSEYSTAINIS